MDLSEMDRSKFLLCFAHVSLSNQFPTVQITNCPNIAVYLYSFVGLFGQIFNTVV